MRTWMCTTIWSLYDESSSISPTNRQLSAARNSAEPGRWLPVGFLVSGASQLRDQGPKTRHRHAVGNAFSAGTHFGGKGLRDAGCLSTSGNSLVVRKI